MKYLVPPEKPSQSILVGCLLAASGGLQDAYTYNVRDQVFANAQTGNMVLVGQSLALGQWAVAVEHLIPCLTSLDTARALVTCLGMDKSMDDIGLVDITKL